MEEQQTIKEIKKNLSKLNNDTNLQYLAGKIPKISSFYRTSQLKIEKKFDEEFFRQIESSGEKIFNSKIKNTNN